MDNCNESESDGLRSKIYSCCTEMKSSGNSSPYLLSTIMDLDKEEGLRKGDTAQLQNAIQVIWLKASMTRCPLANEKIYFRNATFLWIINIFNLFSF